MIDGRALITAIRQALEEFTILLVMVLVFGLLVGSIIGIYMYAPIGITIPLTLIIAISVIRFFQLYYKEKRRNM
jgi:hypothetical protein